MPRHSHRGLHAPETSRRKLSSSSIQFSVLEAIYLAKHEILITTPYFIPGESILEAITVAALSGLSVKLLVPAHADVPLVNAAARAYYEELLHAGVEIQEQTVPLFVFLGDTTYVMHLSR